MEDPDSGGQAGTIISAAEMWKHLGGCIGVCAEGIMVVGPTLQGGGVEGIIFMGPVGQGI